MPREKSRYRDRRSSSYSSESSHDRKKSNKSKHRRRSRSRDRSISSSLRRKRSNSRSKYRRRTQSRSVSRERYEKSRRRSTSRSRSKRSRHSRERSKSRSRSHSRSKYSKSSKKHKKRSRSASDRDSRASSFDIEPRKLNIDDTEIKIEKAIKAAEAAGLTLTKLPTYEYKEVAIKEEMPTMHDRNLIAELNSDSFVQKPFVSSRSKKQSQNIVIDLNAETVKLPKPEVKVQNDDSIINLDEIPSHEELKEMWIRKLFQYRKKMLRDEMQ